MWPWEQPPFDKDISFVQGDDFSLPVNLNTPVSGFVYDAHITLASGVAAFDTADTGPDGTVVQLSLTGAETSPLAPGVYPWQFSFVNYLGQRITWYQGNATVLPNL